MAFLALSADCIYQSALLYLVFSSFLTRKYSTRITALIFITILTITSVYFRWAVISGGGEGKLLATVSVLVAMLVLLFLLFLESWFNKVLLFIFVYFMVVFSEVIMQLILIEVFEVNLGFVNQYTDPSAIAARPLFWLWAALTAWLIIRVWKLLMPRLVNFNFMHLLLILLLVIQMIPIIATLNYWYQQGQLQWRLWWIIYTVTANMLIILVLYTMRHMSLQEINAERLAFYEKQMQLQFDHYSQQNEYIEAIRNIHHDFNNQITTVKSLLNRSNYAQARNLLSKMEEEVAATEYPSYCANRIIDALLLNKRDIAVQLGINMEYEVNLIEDISIDILHLSKIYSNLLDNAINACMQLPVDSERLLKLSTFDRAGYLIIKAANTVDISFSMDDVEQKRKFNSKPLPNSSGLGLQIIKQIADEYNGKIEMTAVERTFFVTVWLRIPQ